MDFIATTEDDKTLMVMFDLEQELGREIVWVAGETFENLIRRKKMLPNIMARFCTTELKMKPIFDWWKGNIGEIVKMRCGYRYDEIERKDTFSTFFRTIIGKSKNGKRNRWANVEYRIGDFPLIDYKINNWDILEFWKNKYAGLTFKDFPEDSNCVGCFWKQIPQLRKNWEDNPKKMHWFANQESKNKRWKKQTNYDNIAKLGLQSNFFFGTGSGCQAGACTD
jgi:hypothetical protein